MVSACARRLNEFILLLSPSSNSSHHDLHTGDQNPANRGQVHRSCTREKHFVCVCRTLIKEDRLDFDSLSQPKKRTTDAERKQGQRQRQGPSSSHQR